MVDTDTTPAPDATAAAPDDDGRHDFDFVAGSWDIVHRRLVRPLDPSCDEWAEFTGTSEAELILDGLGNTDRLWVPALPGGGALEGYTLRLFEPATATWRIWWASTTRPGRLDPPVEGRFVDGVGRFEAHDELDGVSIEVRFEWTGTHGPTPQWAQAFSFDGGATWVPNWTMSFTRRVAPA